MFEAVATDIREILGDNCVAIHHIGSTSVKGLAAKPVIDIVMEVKDQEKTITCLESLGYLYKGEYNIPMRLYFNKKKPIDVNLHVYEEDHPEIELNLLFRDYLRDHQKSVSAYALLKTELLKNPSSFEKNKASFTGYNLGKDDFIRTILKQAGFNRIRFMRCMHHTEIETANYFAKNTSLIKYP
ncbi:MAG: GrpB family protein [Alphaproteobacteria bacterium]|nr:GrpB family protein [Alphaproteobacteria bacterium]